MLDRLKSKLKKSNNDAIIVEYPDLILKSVNNYTNTYCTIYNNLNNNRLLIAQFGFLHKTSCVNI